MADAAEVKNRLKHGADFPFDAPDSWWEGDASNPPAAKDWAHAAVRGILADLGDRHTIKHGFDEIDEEIRIELVDTLAAIIREARAGEIAGYVVANANRDKFRCWKAEGPAWTEDIEKAVVFVRREDAEAVFAEDEDAWRIVSVTVADLYGAQPCP